MGVMALIIVLSVMTGFTEGLRDQILGINSHIMVQQYGGPSSTRRQSPTRWNRSRRDGDHALYLRPGPDHRRQQSSGVVLRGIDPRHSQARLSISAGR